MMESSITQLSHASSKKINSISFSPNQSFKQTTVIFKIQISSDLQITTFDSVWNIWIREELVDGWHDLRGSIAYKLPDSML